MHSRRNALLTALLAVAACKDTPNEPDAGDPADVAQSDLDTPDGTGAPDATPDLEGPTAILGSRQLSPAQAGVSPDGVDPTAPANGAARAGRFADPNTGFHGVWAHCKQGDLALYNDRIELCISGVKSNRYETFTGGYLVDARTAGNEAEEVFDLYLPRLGFNTADAHTVEVVRDGSDGGPAVVRMTGTDMPIAHFVGVLSDLLFKPNGIDVEIEYRLGPGDDFVEIATRVRNASGSPVRNERGSWTAFGDRARVFRPGTGFDLTKNTEFEYLAAMGGGHSFALVGLDGPQTIIAQSIGRIPWQIIETHEEVLQDGSEYFELSRLVVGGADYDRTRVRAEELLGGTAAPVRALAVTDANGRPAADRWVEVFDGETAVAATQLDAGGTAKIHLPDGSFRFVIDGVLGGGAFDGEVSVSEVSIAIEVPAVGVLEVIVTEEGRPQVALVEISGAAQTRLPTPEGTLRVEAMPGDYHVVVSRGPEYDHFEADLSVVAGEVASANGSVSRVLLTDDWINADFHQHMEPSVDSEVTLRDRVLDNVAMGVEFAAPTDHEVVTDLGPDIAALGLGGELATAPGIEISPSFGHVNFFPVEYRPDERGRGTTPLAILVDGKPKQQTIPELIASARASNADTLFQINHGRGSSGWLESVSWDPSTDPRELISSRWTTEVDSIEILNEFSTVCPNIADLAGFWNVGLRLTAIGSSDSHGVWGRSGQARTWLHIPGATPATLTGLQVRDALAAGRASVGGNAFVDFTDGKLPGDAIVSPGPTAFAVRIQSPTWAGIDTLHVLVNGTVVDTIGVDMAGSTVWETTYTADQPADYWIAFIATGPRPAGPVDAGGRPSVAMTTPISVDLDGQGWNAPGPSTADLAAVTRPGLCD